MQRLPPLIVLVSTVIISILLFAAIGSIPLSSLNEGRRALVVQEMFQHHAWLLPSMNGELYLTKPPLFYWTALAFSHLFGAVTEWSLRLPSALAAAAVLWLTYFTGRKYFSTYVAILATVLLAANLEFALMARRAEIEMLLTLFCMGAWVCFIQYIQTNSQRMLMLSYALLALAVMTKGPVAMLFVTVPAIIYGVVSRDKSVLQFFTHLRAWLIFIILAGTWYLLVSLQLGFDIWASVIQRDMLDKMQSEANAKPFLSYLGWILVDFYFLITLMLWRGKNFIQQLKNNKPALLLIWGALIPFIVFSFFANKHTKYLLPIYPWIALLLAWHVSLIAQYGRQKFAQGMLTLGLVLAATVMLFYIVFEKHYFQYRFSAFKHFAQWHQQFDGIEMVSLKSVDSRLVFYTGKPIAVVQMSELIQRGQQKQSILVVAEDSPINFDKSIVSCTMQTFKPYIKKTKSLYVYGLGKVCEQGDKEQ